MWSRIKNNNRNESSRNIVVQTSLNTDYNYHKIVFTTSEREKAKKKKNTSIILMRGHGLIKRGWGGESTVMSINLGFEKTPSSVAVSKKYLRSDMWNYRRLSRKYRESNVSLVPKSVFYVWVLGVNYYGSGWREEQWEWFLRCIVRVVKAPPR